MDIKMWQRTNFQDKNIPNWNCPFCMNGILELENFFFGENALSHSLRAGPNWDPECLRYTFTGNLKCPICKEFVAFAGEGYEEFIDFYDEYNDKYINQNFSLFTPKFFLPNLIIFDINSNCPPEVSKVINESFSLFWNDLPSCANKIRVSLELLMDKFKIKKTFIRQHKRKKLTLHARIELFKQKKPEVADYLLAIKLIGNVGSHIGRLAQIDILETYELLEFSLNKLYDNTEKKLQKVSKEIIKRKGVRKRR